jgi:hypothetical protein
VAIPTPPLGLPRPPYYLCAASEEALWQGLLTAGLSNLQFPKLDVIGSLFVPTGLVLADEQDHRFPHFRPIQGYYAAIHQELTEVQRSMLPIVPRPAAIVRVCA